MSHHPEDYTMPEDRDDTKPEPDLRDLYPINTFSGKTQDELVEFIKFAETEAYKRGYEEGDIQRKNWEYLAFSDGVKAMRKSVRNKIVPQIVPVLHEPLLTQVIESWNKEVDQCADQLLKQESNHE